jgi:hypothetical protein
MNRINLLFGGLGYSRKVLKKFADIYDGKTIIIPFTLPCMIMGQKYSHYARLNEKCKNYYNIHIHVLSGSCHYLHNYLDKYPNNIQKIKSQVYDSPCHINGVTAALKQIYGIPSILTKPLINTLFYDCIRTSDSFVNKALLQNIPTGMVNSTNDSICPPGVFNEIITNWKSTNDIEILKTDSEHLHAYKDYEFKYRDFCLSVKHKDSRTFS